MNKIALLVVYNHRYDKNIPVIEKMYRDRFTYIYHIMPFYDGDKDNVITVYENSYYYEGYIAQAYSCLKDKGFSHFFTIADDMIINPSINENSLFEITGIPEDYCYIPGFFRLQKEKDIGLVYRLCYYYNNKPGGIDTLNVLPTVEEARNSFKELGLSVEPLRMKDIDVPFRLKLSMYIHKIKGYAEWFCKRLFRYIKAFFIRHSSSNISKSTYYYNYPLVMSWSDINIITAEIMPRFVNYCGYFAATHLFVEVAIPTALAYSTSKIVQEKDIKLKVQMLDHPGYSALFKDGTREEMFQEQQKTINFLDGLNYNVRSLMENYPKNLFCIHPVKLSKWKYDE